MKPICDLLEEWVLGAMAAVGGFCVMTLMAIRLDCNCWLWHIIGSFLRRLALPKSINDWSLRAMREKLIKIGAKVASYVRYWTFERAEVLVSKTLF